MEDIFKDLNNKQIEAVRAIEGPVLILAGAGSGKTKALTHRIAHMIASGIRPENILAVTFTNKASGEMKERIEKLLAGPSIRSAHSGRLAVSQSNPLVGTFHSICVRILRRELEQTGWGYSRGFAIYDEDDQKSIVKKVMHELELDPKKFNPNMILGKISKLKSELVGHEEYVRSAKDYWEKTLSKIYTDYQVALLKNNALDFDDLIMLSVRLFQKYPEILAKYQDLFRYILVDECLPYDMPVLLANGSSKKIGELVDGKEPALVLTYNLGTGKQEVKKIIGWQKTPADNKKFLKITVAKRCNKRNRYKTKYKKATIRNIFCTDNHKIFANSNYARADELQLGDVLQWESDFTECNVKFCTECKKIYKTGEMHLARHKAYPAIKCTECDAVYKSRFQFRIHQEKHRNPQYKRDYVLSQKGLATLQLRMLKNNPMSIPEIRQKAGRSRSLFWARLPQEERNKRLKRLMDLPVFSYHKPPTKPERVIQSLNIAGLKYSGKGDVWVTFKDGQHKCPDFIARGQNKVIEVADFEYWHTKKEMETLKKKYAEIGFKCLVLDAQQVVLNPDHYKTKIKRFLNDCPTDVEVIAIERLKDVGERFVYDIEVEDNHNFYANGILVHNCQDVNLAQYVWTKLLAEKYRNIFWIGDDYQAIFQWRGADPKYLISFEKDYPEAKVIMLEQNYRSTKTILTAANNIIVNNKNQKHKKLWTENRDGAKIALCELGDERREGEYIVKTIREGLRQGRTLNNFTILYRTHAQSRAIEEVMVKHGFPYRIIGGVKFYQRREVKDILAYLRLALNPRDEASLERIYNVPPRGIGNVSFEKFKLHYHNRESSQWPNENSDGKLRDFAKLLSDLHKKSAELPPATLAKYIIQKTGYEPYINDKTDEGEERWENVRELLSVARKYDPAETPEGLASFLEEVALVQETDRFNKGDSVINLMTVHSAKGLEFPVVFIVGMEDGLFPISRALFEPHELEEERRLCYVAITRAKEDLHLTYCRQRMLYGSPQFNSPSRFIFEIPENLLDYKPVAAEPDDDASHRYKYGRRKPKIFDWEEFVNYD